MIFLLCLTDRSTLNADLIFSGPHFSELLREGVKNV